MTQNMINNAMRSRGPEIRAAHLDNDDYVSVVVTPCGCTTCLHANAAYRTYYVDVEVCLNGRKGHAMQRLNDRQSVLDWIDGSAVAFLKEKGIV